MVLLNECLPQIKILIAVLFNHLCLVEEMLLISHVSVLSVIKQKVCIIVVEDQINNEKSMG